MINNNVKINCSLPPCVFNMIRESDTRRSTSYYYIYASSATECRFQDALSPREDRKFVYNIKRVESNL